jgi:hypothetical protein
MRIGRVDLDRMEEMKMFGESLNWRAHTTLQWDVDLGIDDYR